MSDWNDAERRVERAQRFFEQRQWTAALREIRAATELNPYHSAWFFNMGLILDELGRYDEALEAYRQADQIDPSEPQTLLRIGVDQFRAGHPQDSLETFTKLQSQEPAFEPGYCNSIPVFTRLGQHDKAEEMFYTARLYREHCPVCYYHIAASLEARGLYDKAIFCWTKALDFQGEGSEVGDIHAHIALAHWKSGRLEEARRHFLADLRLNPGSTSTLLDLGQLLIDLNRLDEAAEKFRQAIDNSPDEAVAHCRLGRLLVRRKQFVPATVSLGNALRLDPTVAGAHLGLAKIALQKDDADTALIRLHAELRLRPEDPRLLLELANMLMDVGDARSAHTCLEWLVSLQPDQATGWLNLAVCQFSLDRPEEGIRSFQVALAKDPKNPLALYNLAFALGERRQYDRAMAYLRQARTRDPEDLSLQRLELRIRIRRGWFRLSQKFKHLWGMRRR